MNEHTEHFATKADLINLKADIINDIAEREHRAARKEAEKWYIRNWIMIGFLFGLSAGFFLSKFL